MEKDDRSTENDEFTKERLRLGVFLIFLSTSFLTGIFLKIEDVNVLGGAAFLAGLIALTGINLIASANPRV